MIACCSIVIREDFLTLKYMAYISYPGLLVVAQVSSGIVVSKNNETNFHVSGSNLFSCRSHLVFNYRLSSNKVCLINNTVPRQPPD